ncbi:mannonate dehydratase [Cellulomonas denverensis]|uniref:Mannonate dehydratase n=1 Tax=Cellulomonas denverensis TaxID=264297 RepID=A0A7X6KYB6_9CELL|nr:mannonate dehydratase [Cellulomonas denverensis]NKY24244.1 mannonate dehydratase [Cellulomonas denverensis]GIG24839.1 mannonate dehydratase [Cellulomonas denverensis]
MEHTWRWFGDRDPITLAQVRQTGATGVVTALHDIPNGEVWPVEAIQARQETIEAAGLRWSVVESVPVHEDIKRGGPRRERAIAAYQQTLRNLATCGIDVVCYNFMPVLDWSRTDLSYRLPDGTWALRFDADQLAAFDLFLLRRPGAASEYDAEQTARARAVFDGLDDAARDRLIDTILLGLPGSEERYTLDEFREALTGYVRVDAEALRANLASFLRAVVPVAEQAGVRLAIHPDDPPRPLFGLPRVVSTAEDVDALLAAAPSPANGLTLCVGSFGSRPDNDVVDLARRFAERIYFAHLRSVRLQDGGRHFYEAPHIAGDADMVAVIAALVTEERRRVREGGPRIPMRPDHGQRMLDDQFRETYPGYSLIGRLKGLAELRGVEQAVQRLLPA